MKRVNLALVMLAIFLLLSTSVYAIVQPRARESWQKTSGFFYGSPGTLIGWGDIYQHTFYLDTQGITWDSCFDPNVYQYGTCSYLYKAYIVLPEGCTEVECSVQREFIPIETLGATEQIDVAFIPGYITDFAVVAFMAKGNMEFSNNIWNEVSLEILEPTKQSDVVTVEGAPVPPPFDVTAFIQGIITSISGWFCGNFGLLC